MSIYSLSKIRSSLLHFVFGSFVSASMGLVATLLLVRELSVPDYSAYAIFLGLCLLIGGVASFAIEHTAQRFMPELLTTGSKRQVLKYIFIALIAKTGTLSIAVLILLVLINFVVEMFSLSIYVEELQIWMFACFFIIFFRFQTVILQIFLMHKELKWLNIISSGARLILIVLLIRVEQLDLMWVVIIDFGVNAFVLIFSFMLLFMRLNSLPEMKETVEHENKLLLPRVREYRKSVV